MKKNWFIVFIAVICIAGAVVFFSRFGALNRAKEPQTQTSVTQAVKEQQGQTSGTQQPPAQADKQPARSEEEIPLVEIPPDKQQMIGIRTVEVDFKPMQKVLRTVGRIEYDERRLSTINTKMEGWIEKLYVDYTGRYVKKGEAVAEIYSPELIATQQEFINALKWTKQGGDIKNENMNRMLSGDASALLEAARHRLKLWDITDAQINKIEEAGKPIRTITIYSPVSGYVVQKTALQGMKVMPGERLFDIADLSSLWIVADIYESEMGMIKTGQKAKITLSNFPDKELSSRIEYIYPAISGATRTAKVRFEIPNRDGRLKPQMFSNVEVKIDLGKKLVVPEDAVIDTGMRQVVYVDKGEGFFEPREVMLGARAEGLREVTMGLKKGEKVASSATFLIDSEAQLKNVSPLAAHKH